MKQSETSFTDQQRAVALSFLESTKGDTRTAARKAKVPETALKYWAQGGDTQTLNALSLAGQGRPFPPSSMMDSLRYPETFEPSHDLANWVKRTFISVNGPLYNPDHSHLSGASIGFLWTNVPNQRQMKQIAGEASIPFSQGGKWAKERANHQLREWFGSVPDFVITLDSIFSSLSDDATFCALIEHELYHCAQKQDEFGGPAFTKEGMPRFGMRGHDVEEFVGVVARYGMGASTSPIEQMVKAVLASPVVAPAAIASACGNCLARLSF